MEDVEFSMKICFFFQIALINWYNIDETEEKSE